MSKIIICDNEEVLRKIPNIQKHIYDLYGDSDVIVYAVLRDDNTLCFLTEVNGKCFFIENDEKIKITPFKVDEEGYLEVIERNGYNITFCGDETYMYDYESGITHFLTIDKHDDGMEVDGYDGRIYYVQTNDPKRCEIHYQQMYRAVNGIIPIYENHLRDKDFVILEDNITDKREKGFKKLNLMIGPIGRDSVQYARFDIRWSILAIMLDAYRKEGLLAALGVYKDIIYNGTENYPVLNRFYKIILASESVVSTYPLGEGKTQEEIDDMIRSYGFNTEVPKYVIDVYNEKDDFIEEIVDLLRQIREIKEKELDEKRMLLKIHN